MKTVLRIILLLLLSTPCFSQTPNKSETVILNGIETYYEVYGEGEPLFLLHGWTQASQSWNGFIADFSGDYAVHVVDLMGHGKSATFKDDFDIRLAANNLLSLLNHLGIGKMKAIGLSYGGELLLQLCAARSDRVESMVVIGASYYYPKQDWGWRYEKLDPKYLEWLRDVHIHGEKQIRSFLEQMPNYEILLSNEQVRNISTNTLIVVGETDNFVDIDTAAKLHNLMPDSFLWIVPHTGHVAHTGDNKPEFVRITKEFLSGKWGK